MAWNLAAPVNCGDLDDGTYGEAKIVRFTQDSNRNRMDVRLEYGNTVDGTWVGGYLPQGKSSYVIISDADYGDVVSDSVPDVQTSDPSDDRYAQVGDVWVEKTYEATKRALYEWLVANDHIEAGTLS